MTFKRFAALSGRRSMYLKKSTFGDNYITTTKDESVPCRVSWMNGLSFLKDAVSYQKDGCT